MTITYFDAPIKDEQRDEYARPCSDLDAPILNHSQEIMSGVLDEAKRITTGDRHESYGPPEINHARTAGAFNWYLSHCKRPLDGRDVAWLNVLQKISRDLHLPLRDNCVDVCGFAANAAVIGRDRLNGT